jgi:hypothetical protein
MGDFDRGDPLKDGRHEKPEYDTGTHAQRNPNRQKSLEKSHDRSEQ